MLNKKVILTVLAGLALVGILIFVNPLVTQVAAQGRSNYPVFVQLNSTAPTLQSVFTFGSGPSPQGSGTPNAAPLYYFAQLVRDPDPQTPFASVPVNISTLSITPFAGAQSFTAVCTGQLTTEVRCTLTPTGATWVAGPPVVGRLQASDADGNVVNQLIQFRIN